MERVPGCSENATMAWIARTPPLSPVPPSTTVVPISPVVKPSLVTRYAPKCVLTGSFPMKYPFSPNSR
jgi:hypothetical protein